MSNSPENDAVSDELARNKILTPHIASQKNTKPPVLSDSQCPPLTLQKDETSLLLQNAKEAADLAVQDGILEESYFQVDLAEQNANEMSQILTSWKEKGQQPQLQAQEENDVDGEDNTTLISYDNLETYSINECITMGKNKDLKQNPEFNQERTVVFNLETELCFAADTVTETVVQEHQKHPILSSLCSTTFNEHASPHGSYQFCNAEENYSIASQSQRCPSLLSDAERDEFHEAVRSAEKTAKDMEESLALTTAISCSSFSLGISTRKKFGLSTSNEQNKIKSNIDLSSNQISSVDEVENSQFKYTQAEYDLDPCKGIEISKRNELIFRSAEKVLQDLEETLASSITVTTNTSSSIISSDMTYDTLPISPPSKIIPEQKIPMVESHNTDPIMDVSNFLLEDEIQQQQYHLYCCSLDGFLPKCDHRKKATKVILKGKNHNELIFRSERSGKETLKRPSDRRFMQGSTTRKNQRKHCEGRFAHLCTSFLLPPHDNCSIWNRGNRKLRKRIIRQSFWCALLSTFVIIVGYKASSSRINYDTNVNGFSVLDENCEVIHTLDVDNLLENNHPTRIMT